MKKIDECSYVSLYLGGSDIARLILSSPNGVKELSMREDGDYLAKLIDDQECDLKDYHLVLEEDGGSWGKTWVKIYDDEKLTNTIKAREIKVYQKKSDVIILTKGLVETIK